MQRRNTPAKQEILLMLQDAHSALSQDMIEQQMKGTVDRVTIYRVLNSFCEDGIVHKIVSDEGKTTLPYVPNARKAITIMIIFTSGA